MKSALIVFSLLSLIARADLVITEVMSSSAHTKPITGTGLDADWWELTNTGPAAVDLTGYSWDDNTPSPSFFPNGTSIAAGESIIILQDSTGGYNTAWKAAWGLTTTQVLSSQNFTPGAGGQLFSSFSSTADSVSLFDDNGIEVASVDIGVATTGRSFAFLQDARPILGFISVSGKHGAYLSTVTTPDIASPGNEKIRFTSTPNYYAVGSYSYTMSATNPGFPTPTFSATGLPSFLTLGASSGGSATLSSNRALTLADTGEYTITLTATSSTSTTQDFKLTVMNSTPTIILNEYNAVAATNYLNDDPLNANDGPASQDTYFGEELGNGGNWVEFVVVGNGSAQLVDLRGWKIQIGKNDGAGFVATNTIVLSNASQWQNVPTGTILTFIARNASAGLTDGGVNGVNTGFGITNQRSTTGVTWTNIWLGDTIYTTYTSAAFNGYTITGNIVTGINIGNSGTQFRILNPSNQATFGPAGEGVAPYSGTSSKEVFELENHPTPSISPAVASSATVQGYDDGASESTFGSPNNWTEGIIARTQNFTPYKATGFVIWAESFNLTGNNALATADPDADGRDNFQEYTFGGSPLVKDAAHPTGAVTVSSQITWSYLRRVDSAVTYALATSADLQTWNPITPSSSSTAADAQYPGFTRVTVSFPKPSNTSKWFLRATATP